MHIVTWYRKLSDDVDTTAYKSLQLMKHELTATLEGERCTSQLQWKETLYFVTMVVVIPTTVQKQAKNQAREGRQCMVKIKALIREKVWFPAIDKTAEQCVRSCVACQASVVKTKQEPLHMSPLTKAP